MKAKYKTHSIAFLGLVQMSMSRHRRKGSDRPIAVTIYTVGYGSRTKEEILNLLAMHGVQVVVDVRRWPTSKLERFRGNELSQWLLAEGVDYVWMGEELGGFRRGGYEAHVASESFRRGIQQLLSLAATRRTCLLCLETSPRGCHRRFIATYLDRKCGVKVLHILSKKKLVDHASLPCTTRSRKKRGRTRATANT